MIKKISEHISVSDIFLILPNHKPAKVGNEPKALRGRLQPSSRRECDLLRKRRSSGILLRSDFCKQKSEQAIYSLLRHGAAGRGRTVTVSLPPDFESGASANSTTAAYNLIIISHFFMKVKKNIITAEYFLLFQYARRTFSPQALILKVH